MKHAPYWWEEVEWPDLSGTPPAKTDLLVIGAGYTGLSAAIAAHDAGAKVVVLDAGQPGQGASTRNGGMVGAHPRLGWEALARDFGDETADALFAEAAPALQWVKDLIAREKIACDFEETGRIQLAYTPAHHDKQKRLAETVTSKSSVRCLTVPRARLEGEISTDLYHGALLFPEHGALHPAKFHAGLLKAALDRDIPVISECPATAFGPPIETPKGQVVADKILLATNGYTKSPFTWFAQRVFPLPSFLIATEPLSANLLGELAPGRRMMVETRALHSYFRLSPDGSRILFGGRSSMLNIDLHTAAQRLKNTMVEIWPILADVGLTHVWTGNTGFAFGHMPHVGENNGIHYAMGFSGSGTVMAPYLGAKAAYQALGLPEGATAYSQTQLQTRWYHRGGRPHFLRPADLWYRQWVDRRETRASRPKA